MNCTCIDDVDQKLKDKNIKIAGVAFVWPNLESRFTISTEWIDPNKVPRRERAHCPKIHVTYCPFCGRKA